MTKNIRIIGVPMDLGQDRRGVDMGPSALRVAGLNAAIRELDYSVEDTGNLEVKVPETLSADEKPFKHLPDIAETCARLAQAVDGALEAGAFPLVLGGDHSIAIGSLAGVSSHFRQREQSIGCLWFDAHGDINTPETSPSGNVHGMPLACSLGLGPAELTNLLGYQPKLEAKHCAQVGIRSLDPGEKKIVAETGVRVLTMRDLDEKGMRACLEEAIKLATRDTAGFHVSLDMDFLDPQFAPGVGTPVRGGVTYREAHLALEMVADTGKMLSLEVVEINPVIDEHNQTAQLGVELIQSAFGKKIL